MLHTQITEIRKFKKPKITDLKYFNAINQKPYIVTLSIYNMETDNNVILTPIDFFHNFIKFKII